jgi:predicted transcriptional regulator
MDRVVFVLMDAPCPLTTGQVVAKVGRDWPIVCKTLRRLEAKGEVRRWGELPGRRRQMLWAYVDEDT